MLYILLALAFLSATAIVVGAQMFSAGYWLILIFIGLWAACFLGWAIIYLLWLLIVSLLVNKKKEITKPSKFY